MSSSIPLPIGSPVSRPLPETFGRYVLVRKLQSSGRADVFLALQRSLAGVEKLVVIQRLDREAASDMACKEALLREGCIAGQLAHPNIVQGFDVGERDGGYFLSLEYVCGQSLRSILNELASKGTDGVPLELALAMVVTLCATLAYTHERRDVDGAARSLAHGALGPDNVLVSYSGEVKVAGFGTASTSASPADDIFALGAILFELTAGRALSTPPPWGGLTKLLGVSYPAPHRPRRHYPPALDAIVRRATANQPQRRYASAGDMQTALEQLARDNGHSASQGSMGIWMGQLFQDRGYDRELREARNAFELVSSRAPAPESEPAPAVRTIPPPAPAASRYRRSFALLAAGATLGAWVGVNSAKNGWPTTSHGAGSPPAHLNPGQVARTDSRGRLEIVTSPPGCAIWIDGDLQEAITPGVIEHLPLDRPVHLRLTREGFVPRANDVELTPDHAEQKLTWELERATFTLRLTVDAPQYALWVDDQYHPAPVVQALSVGEDHKLAVSAPGRVGKVVFVRADQAADQVLAIKLAPIRRIR